MEVDQLEALMLAGKPRRAAAEAILLLSKLQPPQPVPIRLAFAAIGAAFACARSEQCSS
jgi:hypothetical protein